MMAFQLPGPRVAASVHHTGVKKGPWIRIEWLGFSGTGLSKSKGDKKKLGQRSSGEAGRGMGGRRDLPGMAMTGSGMILTEKMTTKMKTIGRTMLIGIVPGIGSKTIGKTGRIGIVVREMAPADLALDLQRQRLERRLQHVFLKKQKKRRFCVSSFEWQAHFVLTRDGRLFKLHTNVAGFVSLTQFIWGGRVPNPHTIIIEWPVFPDIGGGRGGRPVRASHQAI